MREQRESYESLRAIAEALAGPTNAADMARALRTVAHTADFHVREKEMQITAANLLQHFESLAVRAREILSQAPRHPSWPCEGCIRWEAGACNRKIYGGFW